MIENNISQKDRLEKLNATAKRQITILTNDSNVIGISKTDSQKLISNVNIKNKGSANNGQNNTN